MATLNYTRRLAELQNRKYDQELRESLLSKSFSDTGIPENVRYLVESMKPIDDKYNQRTVEAATRVMNHLENGLKLHFGRVYKTQGSVRTRTNIRAHSDFDLLSIIDRYFYPEVSNGNNYTASDPNEDIIEFRKQAITILKGVYDEVDDKGEKCITILNKSLRRKVDIVFGFWYHSQKYEETKNEYYRGVHLFNFPAKRKETPADYPFATIGQVNSKGDETMDGSRMGIRLLKNLKIDGEVDLNSFQLTSLVHAIPSESLLFRPGNELMIAQVMSGQFARCINDPLIRKSIKGPNGLQTPLLEDAIVPKLSQMKEDLDTLIVDAAKEIGSSPYVKKAILTY